MNVVFRRTTTGQLTKRWQSVYTQFSRYMLPMMCNVLARNLFVSKKLYIGFIATFQKNTELDFEKILDSYNFLE